MTRHFDLIGLSVAPLVNNLFVRPCLKFRLDQYLDAPVPREYRNDR